MNAAALIRSAKAAESAGQVAAAEQFCSQALVLDPAYLDALLMAGAMAARSGRADEAVPLLKRAASADPNSYDALRWLSTLLVGRGGGMEAVDYARSALRLRPNEAEAHVILGLALIAAALNNDAIESLKRAIELRPDMAGAYHNLGVAYQNDEGFDDAVKYFKRAIELSPNLVASHLHLAMAYLELGDADNAIASSERALKISPKSTTARKLIIDANLAGVEGENGEEHIRRAMQRSPNAALPHAMLASRRQDLGDFAEAELSIRRALELEPHLGFAYYLLAHNKKMGEEERPLAERIEEMIGDKSIHPSDRRHMYFALGKIYDDLREYEKAICNFDLANGESDGISERVPEAEKARHGAKALEVRELLRKQDLGRYAGAELESNKPIFIVGMPRSGTTLLEQVLSRHSRVGAAGEQSFWRDRRRKIFDMRNGVLRTPELKEVGEAYVELLSSIAPGKPRVTDKWPSNYLLLGVLHLAFPNATILHARRHPIDICLSMYMRPFHRSSDQGGRRWKIVASYLLYREMMAHWRATLPEGRFMDVQYEEMVSDPENMTGKVLDYCGLDWEDACLSPQGGQHRVRTFSKWQVRQPIYTTSVERWRRYEPWLGVFRELLPFAQD